MVYTRRGDDGDTDLASGERVSKSSARINAYGTIDELNSVIGLAASTCGRKEGELETIQNELHILQAELSDMEPEHIITEENTEHLEELCDSYQEELPPLQEFILAGGAESASVLHLGRSVARRAERKVVALDKKEGLRDEILNYINRLSDLLFLMARHENHVEGVEEKNPDY